MERGGKNSARRGAIAAKEAQEEEIIRIGRGGACEDDGLKAPLLPLSSPSVSLPSSKLFMCSSDPFSLLSLPPSLHSDLGSA